MFSERCQLSQAIPQFHVERMSQRRKKRTRPPPKENLLGNFSGLKENLSRSVVDTETLIKTRQTISTTEIFPLWTPFFFAKKSSALEQGGVCFLFPSVRRMNANRAIRIAAQRTQGLRTKFCVFRWRSGRQRTLVVIRIAATTLASDSAITIARFRPSKI